MLLYLDMCSIQRPYDDRTQARVRIEAEAVLGLMEFCISGGASLVSSAALEYESAQNPHPIRRAFADDFPSHALTVIQLTDELERTAETLVAVGIKPFDALHLASATDAGADYLCSCDDRFLQRASQVHTPPPKVISPVDLVKALGL